MTRIPTTLHRQTSRLSRVAGAAALGLFVGWAVVAANPSEDSSRRVRNDRSHMKAGVDRATPAINYDHYSISGNHPWDRHE